MARSRPRARREDEDEALAPDAGFDLVEPLNRRRWWIGFAGGIYLLASVSMFVGALVLLPKRPWLGVVSLVGVGAYAWLGLPLLRCVEDLRHGFERRSAETVRQSVDRLARHFEALGIVVLASMALAIALALGLTVH